MEPRSTFEGGQPRQLEEQLLARWPVERWRDVTCVVAVSGGADSVALLRALCSVRQPGAGQLVVAHFNHGWRGDESTGDEQFVASLAESLELTCEVGRADVASRLEKPASEDVARHARYKFLQEVAETRGARYVVTAHTADDRAETVLHRVLRGTGLAGLCGIPSARMLGHASLVRPLLGVWRADVLGYLEQLGQPYREDSTNRDRRFTRNRLRHELLPHVAEAYNPNVREALVRLAVLAEDAQQLIDQRIARLDDGAIEIDAQGRARVDCRALREAAPYLVRELMASIWRRQNWPLQAMGYAQWQQLADMVLAADGDRSPTSTVFPGAIKATCRNDILALSRAERTSE